MIGHLSRLRYSLSLGLYRVTFLSYFCQELVDDYDEDDDARDAGDDYAGEID